MTAISIVNAGTGYTSAPDVFIVAPTELAMVPAAPNNAYPTWPRDGRDGGVPDPTQQGPAWLQLGNEGGLLAVLNTIPQQPVSYEDIRQVIPFAGVKYHSLLIMPAQRADVVMDLRNYQDGDTIIVYNDAPAPMPFFWPINDYYTGSPDQTAVGGAVPTQAGYGPNTRTVMQIRIKGTKTSAFNFSATDLQNVLPTAFSKSQDKPLVPQLAYNAAYPGFASKDIYAQAPDTVLNVSGAPGSVTTIRATAPGNNYTVAPTVMILGGGTGAAATAGLNPMGGITLTATGTGYTSPPTVTISAPGAGGVRATAVATISGGGVNAINIVEPGSNYSTTVAPTITITGGGGTGAAATGMVATANTVGSITVTSGGTGYTGQPVVYIVPAAGTNGMGAAAVAMISGGIPMTGKAITEGFDPDYGRMDICLGSTPNPLTPSVGAGMVMGIARYIDPPTEIVNDGEVTLWRIGHLGVDSHALHFHLFDVQVVNRVDWTNVIKPPYADELGWRDTIRTNPMEDIIVAFKPHAAVLPFQIPNSVRLLDPTTPANSTVNFLPIAPPAGVAAAAQLSNVMTNFGWEYVWHCHMLGHEENDFMRPIVFIVPPPTAPTTLTAISNPTTNTAAAPVNLAWVNTAANASGFTVERATNTAFTTGLTTFTVSAPGAAVYTDTTAAWNTRYYYRVASWNAAGNSAWSNTATVTTPRGPVPMPPTGLTAGTVTATSAVLSWTNGVGGAAMTGVQIQRSTNATFTAGLSTTTVNNPTLTTRTMTGLRTKTTYYFRVADRNANGNSTWSAPIMVTTP